MVWSWARGAPAPSNPWRALTLEWQVSSPPPVFNFDEIPQVVGSPYEYGVRGARHAVMDRRPVETGRAPVPVTHVEVDLTSPRERAHVLVIANQTIVGGPLLGAIAERAKASPAEFTLVAPADQPGVRRRLERALERLHESGIEATGHIGDPDPVTAALNAVHDEQVDEIIVSTFPEATSGWLRRDVVGRIREGTQLAVTHVVVEAAEAEALV